MDSLTVSTLNVYNNYSTYDPRSPIPAPLFLFHETAARARGNFPVSCRIFCSENDASRPDEERSQAFHLSRKFF